MSGDGYRRFHELVRRLRAECPWDIEQTHRSLVPYLIEETFEVVDALDALEPGDADTDRALAEELGDLLFQIEFHAAIAAEEGRFTIDDVTAGIHDKLVRRHPHVFGGSDVSDADEVVSNWEAIKRAERPERTSPFDGIADSLPAAAFAAKAISRAARQGFEWGATADAAAKVREELDEVLAATDDDELHEEVGDLLLAAVVVAHEAGVDPESALRSATLKFRRRFERLTELAADRGVPLGETDRETLLALWTDAKSEPSPRETPGR